MIKANSIYIIASILCAVGIVSCLKSTESDDKQKPEIHDVRLNVNDFILYNERYETIKIEGEDDLIVLKYDTIKLNTQSTGIDTLVMGHQLIITAKLSDNEALSSYMVKIDPAQSDVEHPNDATFTFKKSWNIPVENKKFAKEYIVKQNSQYVANDTIVTSDGKKEPVRQGDYILTFYCTDVAGNNNLIEYKAKVLSEKNIIESRISKK